MPGQQSFSDVQPIQQSFSNVVPIGSGDSTGPVRPSTPVDWDALKDKYGVPRNYDLAKSYAENARRADLSEDDWKKVNSNLEGIEKAAYEANPQHPPEGYFGRAWDELKRIGRGLTTESGGALFGNPHENSNVAGFTPPTNPVPAIQQRLQEAKEHPAAAAGAATTDALAATLPFVAGKVVELPAGEIVSGGWRKIGNPLGLASTGQELLTQGISPRTSLLNFKPSLERAAGDLKTFDAQSPINSVQDLHEAIPEIKRKIWSQEVEPALQRQANKPVDMKPVASAVREQISPEMKEFDEANATKLEQLAVKLENTRDVKSANSLLKYINGQLESYFQKFPAARKANLMNNPETAGWEAARATLRQQFLSTLEDAGETGVRDARLRYGAFDTLQDAVERRVNVADRAKPMSLSRIVGLSAAAPTGGLSLILGELSNYLNKPDVLVRRGIRNLPTPPVRTSPFGQPTAQEAAPFSGNLREMGGNQ